MSSPGLMWVDDGDLRGPAGPKGVDGAAGAKGADGAAGPTGPSAIRRNLSTNPNGALSNAGYSAKVDNGQAITAAPLRQTDGLGYQGRTTSLLATAAAAGLGEIALPPVSGLVPGQVFTASEYLNAPATTTAAIAINWESESGAYVTTSVVPRDANTGAYRRLVLATVVPAGAARAIPYITVAGLAAGQTMRLSCNLDEPSSTAGPYIDGDESGGTWSGTAGASSSTVIYATGITGQKGDQGPRGLTGADGAKGADGARGPSGVTTLRGATDYDDSVAPTDGQMILWVASGSKFKAVTVTPGMVNAVSLTATETIGGRKTFNLAPLVPVGDLLANPVRRDDERLSDARSPTAHASRHASGGVDPLSPAAIGAATSGHTHPNPAIPTPVAMTVASGTATPQAAGGAQLHRLSTGASVTVALPDSTVDAQPWTYEITNTAASSITITLAAAYEVGGTGRTRAVVIRAGATAYLFGRMRGTTARLLSVDDGG